MIQPIPVPGNNAFYFTSESVAAGHPDKICDQVSDAILDEYIRHDPLARVGLECFVTPNHIMLGGEVSSAHQLSVDVMERIVRDKIKEIGYTQDPFAWDNVQVINLVNKQSPDIAIGVSGINGGIEGAGDQGIMFGYACDETGEFMPAPIFYAHKLMRTLMEAVKSKELPGLGPDGKCQVTLGYGEGNQPFRVHCLVVSIQHIPQYTQDDIRNMIAPYLDKVFPSGWVDGQTKCYVNPTGRFIIGGPQSDAGLTGRKIIVDTYGGAAPHGGGAFSGKDPSKVDRSAAYAARYLAKNIVAAGVAKRCLIQVAYAIGIAEPLAIYINTFGTSKIESNDITRVILSAMDLTPRGIRNHLQLDKPIYEVTATYGHFGRAYDESNGTFPWEKLDLVGSFVNLL